MDLVRNVLQEAALPGDGEPGQPWLGSVPRSARIPRTGAPGSGAGRAGMLLFSLLCHVCPLLYNCCWLCILPESQDFLERALCKARAASERLHAWGADAPGNRLTAGAEQAAGSASRSACTQQQQQLGKARTGFRQAQWQALHAAALRLLSASLGGDGNQGCLDRRAVAQALAEAVPNEELQAAVHNACVLVDPSCGIKEYQAALAGKRTSHLHRIPSWLSDLCLHQLMTVFFRSCSFSPSCSL